MKQAAFFLLMLMLCSIATAQSALQDYTFAYSVGTYEEITGGLLLGTESNDEHRFLNSDLLNGSEYAQYGIGLPIGFAFRFAGHSFDRLGVNTNGWICLGQSSLGSNAVVMRSSNYINTPLNTTSTQDYGDNTQLVSRIAGAARNLAGQPGSSLRLQTIGSEPNRICVIQWKNYRRLDSTGDSFNFQIRLHESNSMIELSYGLMYCSGEISVSVGLRAEPITTVTNFATRTTLGVNPPTWANSIPGADAVVAMRLDASVYPLPGTRFTWTPPSASSIPLAPQNLRIEIIAADVQLSWDAVVQDCEGNPILVDAYAIYYSESADPEAQYELLGSSDTTSYVHTGIGTTQPRGFYKVYAVTY